MSCEPFVCSVTSDERHLPLLSGWVDFYTRRLYRRIEDVFNRPVLPGLGGDVGAVHGASCVVVFVCAMCALA